MSPPRCVVVEDSRIGLQAAKAAGMTCAITKSSYTGARRAAQRRPACIPAVGGLSAAATAAMVS